MSTSSLYYTQGTVGYQYQKTERSKGVEIYHLRSSARHAVCPKCRSRNTSFAETGKTRDIRGLCIGFKKNDSAHRDSTDQMCGV